LEQLLEDGREQVLAGVLLYVVEAARPIDGARDGCSPGRLNTDKNRAFTYRRISAFIGGQSTFRIRFGHQ
jgi:hypothetical protein